jgi:hypothetical protein
MRLAAAIHSALGDTNQIINRFQFGCGELVP